MAVAYPGTATRVHSQDVDHAVAAATRYIEPNLDRHVSWEETKAYLEAQRSDTKGSLTDGLLLAVLDLEWAGAIQYDTTYFRRPGEPNDAKYAPLDEVADAVLALGWPRPSDGKRSRTIHGCFLELGGRYRHCDVYWAMHEKLKGRKLACHRAYWSLLGDEAILADPTLSTVERVELEKTVEAELCEVVHRGSLFRYRRCTPGPRSSRCVDQEIARNRRLRAAHGFALTLSLCTPPVRT